MSALPTTAMPHMRVEIDTLVERGIRDDVVVVVGKPPVDMAFAGAIAADTYCRDAAVAVATAQDFMRRQSKGRVA